MRVPARLLFTLLLATGTAHALPRYTVCAEPWAPFIDGGSSRPAEGLVVTLLQQVASTEGVTFHYLFKSAGACVRLAREQRVDILAFANAHDSPPAWRQTRTPLVFWLLSAWVPLDSPHREFTGLAAFRGQRVAWVPDYDYPAMLAAKRDWQRVAAPDSAASIQMLAGGRMDVLFDDTQADTGLPAAVRQKVRRLNPLFGSVPQPLSLRPGLETLRQQIEQRMRVWQEDGSVDQFYRRHFAYSWRQVLQAELR